MYYLQPKLLDHLICQKLHEVTVLQELKKTLSYDKHSDPLGLKMSEQVGVHELDCLLSN